VLKLWTLQRLANIPNTELSCIYWKLLLLAVNGRYENGQASTYEKPLGRCLLPREKWVHVFAIAGIPKHLSGILSERWRILHKVAGREVGSEQAP